MMTKVAIAESFSRSATRYDQAAGVQQQAGKALLEVTQRLLPETVTPQVLADIGCGTGFLAPHLIESLKPQQYIGIDLAQGMLDLAAQRHASLSGVSWLCADAENLSLPEASVDLIYANFSLQWCEDLPKLLASFSRVLKPGGYCCFTSLDSNSLHELRRAWSEVDGFTHVNRFYDQLAWREAIGSSELELSHHYQQTFVAHFESVREALRSFKDIGANVVVGSQRDGLTGKKRFAHFSQAYEAQRQEQGIPVSYIVDGWVLHKNNPHVAA